MGFVRADFLRTRRFTEWDAQEDVDVVFVCLIIFMKVYVTDCNVAFLLNKKHERFRNHESPIVLGIPRNSPQGLKCIIVVSSYEPGNGLTDYCGTLLNKSVTMI